MGAVVALFNPILPKQPLDKYEDARIQYRPKNKGFSIQLVNIKKNILKLNPNSTWANLALFNPI